MAYIISESCSSCGLCEEECPIGCIEEGDFLFEIDKDACVECGSCADVCPVGAIELEEDNY